MLNVRKGTVLHKAISESHSDKDHEVFERVESKFAKAARFKTQAKVQAYIASGTQMSSPDLLREKHSSAVLGKHLRWAGIERPGANWEAHHIVSGDHREASVSRSYLADVDIKIRIDDPDNGSWMPKTKADARPTIYPDAIGHNRIHRQRYYDWIQNSLSIMDDPLQVRAFLNTVRTQLLHGNIKPEMKLQQEIDEAEYYDWLKKNQTL